MVARRKKGTLARLAEQFDDLDQQEHADRLGMWVFLGSETLLFAALFALYWAYRQMYGDAFSMAVRQNHVLLGTLNTVVLLTSSLTVALSIASVQIQKPRIAVWWLAASILLGLVFLGIKGVEYGMHIHEGITPGAGYHNEAMPGPGPQLFFRLYYLLTGLHALHVTAGLVVLGWLLVRCRAGAYSAERHVTLEMGGLYWHTIDIIWIFLWPLLYLTG
jgi:cytochrome c oxidase subunit 3